MFALMKTHWHHLANTIEFVLLSAHSTPQPKRQIDRSSLLAQLTAMSGMPGHILNYFPNAPAHRDLGRI